MFSNHIIKIQYDYDNTYRGVSLEFIYRIIMVS